LHGDVGVAACTGDSDSHRGIRRIVQSDRQRVLPALVHIDGGIHIAAGGHFPFLGAGCCVHSVDSVIPRSEIDHVIQRGNGDGRPDGIRRREIVRRAGSIRHVKTVKVSGVHTQNHLIAPDTGLREAAGTLIFRQMPLKDFAPGAIIEV